MHVTGVLLHAFLFVSAVVLLWLLKIEPNCQRIDRRHSSVNCSRFATWLAWSCFLLKAFNSAEGNVIDACESSSPAKDLGFSLAQEAFQRTAEPW